MSELKELKEQARQHSLNAETREEDWPKGRWPNFSFEEVACRHTGLCYISWLLMDYLQRMRSELGAPLVVTSGYRHPTHPVEAGKEKGPGAHATGKAVDLQCHGLLAWRILGWRAPSYVDPTFSGIGISQAGPQDKRFIHLDVLDAADKFHAPRPWVWSY